MIAPDKLPLPLGRRNPADLAGGALPLTLERKRDEVDEAQGPRYRAIAACFAVAVPADAVITTCASGGAAGAALSRCQTEMSAPARAVHACHDIDEQSMARLSHCGDIRAGTASAIGHCSDLLTPAMLRHVRCAALKWLGSLTLNHCDGIVIPAAPVISVCQRAAWRGSVNLAHCTYSAQAAAKIGRCQDIRWPRSREVPCEYYPVPEPPPPPPNQGPCGIAPPADYLPLPLNHPLLDVDSGHLPLPLVCWRERPYISIAKRGYIMHHTITAAVDGEPVKLLSLDLQAGMDGYCWLSTIDIAPADFARIDIDSRAPGKEPMLDIDIDGYQWRLMLEHDYRDNRRHAAHGGRSYSMPGRSVTALIGADYAATQQGIITGARYARQIADEQLKLLPVKIHNWAIADWLVPANTYAITGKTPLAVLGDIAQAAGGYLESHPTRATLDVKPRWPRPAWHLGEPHVTIPATAILAISGQKRLTPRCNGVRVIPAGGGSGGNIYRRGTDSLPRAPDLTHPLYTDQPVWIAAGTAALSDTGHHKLEALELPISRKHAIPLAELGQVWRIEEPGNTWDGVVQSVQISVRPESNGAIKLRQSVTIDRYMGD